MNPLNVKISKPCQQDFSKFSPTENGGFCASCKIDVVDFTKMNADEIMIHFKSNNTQNTCGRFYKSQLTTYTSVPKKRHRLGFLSSFAFSFLAFFSFNKAKAQELQTNIKTSENSIITNTSNDKTITVKGIVTDNEQLPLSGANIIMQGTAIGTQTDFDGYFEFPEPLKKGDVLIVSYIGMKSKK